MATRLNKKLCDFVIRSERLKRTIKTNLHDVHTILALQHKPCMKIVF